MKRLHLIIALISLLAGLQSSNAAVTSWKLRLGLIPGYESNVFHSSPDSFPRSDMVNYLGLSLDLKHKLTRTFEIQFSPSGEFDFYTKHSRRNKFFFGSDAKAVWKLPSRFSLFTQAGVFRRKKDLIDDAGEALPRTLHKWVANFGGGISKRFGSLKSELSYLREFDNYDESADSNGVPLRSYDYDSHILDFGLSQIFKKLHTLRFAYQFEFRNYKERRTLSLDKSTSRPREHRQHSFDFSGSLHLGKVELDAGYEYSKRIDSYQNFYGYDDHQVSGGFSFEYKLDSKLSATYRYKTKDYPNYYTIRIGLLNRVWIHYQDFELKLEHPLARNLTLTGIFQHYRKTSNDIAFEYTDNSFGLGLELSR